MSFGSAMKVNIEILNTEKQNAKTSNLDELSVLDFLTLMNEEDHYCAEAVKQELPQIEIVVKEAITCLHKKGRIIYVGAGTSGRLGILDAVECPPTFSTKDEVIGVIAGGDNAFIKAVEGAEDSLELGREELISKQLSSNDMVIGIAASGRTPYVIGALDYASSVGAKTVSIACNKNSIISKHADIVIEVDAGPEVLTGSTRLKAGTCQKLILNMISTASMVGMGKVYKNLMVDLNPSNEKLVERSKRIIMLACDCDYETAEKAFIESNKKPKIAIVMILCNCSAKEAIAKLDTSKGFIRKAL